MDFLLAVFSGLSLAGVLIAIVLHNRSEMSDSSNV